MTPHFLKFSPLFLLLCIYASNAYSDQAENLEQSLEHHDNDPIVKAVVPEFFPPFYFTTAEGVPYGMGIEVLKEVNHHFRYTIETIVKKNWSEVFSSVASGEAQIIPNLGITEARKKLFFFTQPYAYIRVTVYSRKREVISSINALKKIRVGVVEKNVGVELARKHKLKKVYTFITITEAIRALKNNKIDAIIFPKLSPDNASNTLRIIDTIHDNDLILKTIPRAMAVSKRYPKIYANINSALEEYLQTQEFSDTAAVWLGTEKSQLSLTALIYINLGIFIFTGFIMFLFWKRKISKLVFDRNERHANFIWVISLVAILLSVTSIATISTLVILYQTSFEEQRSRLIDIVKSRARLIESIARYNIINGKSPHRNTASQQTYNHTIQQVLNAQAQFRGFGKTGEFILAKKNNGRIEFVLRQRYSTLETPQPIPFKSALAEPMRLALQGHTGTIVGKDYQGKVVLAAYEPVHILNLGIVAKLDLKEIRAPFIHSALIILAIVILLSLFGSVLFFYIILPILQKIKDTEQRFHQIFLNNTMPVLLVNAANARIIDINTAANNYYHYTTEEMLSYTLDILSVDPSHSVLGHLAKMTNKNKTTFITQHRLQNGDVCDVEMLISPIQLNNEDVLYCLIRDITLKLKKEKKHLQTEKELEQARKMEALGQLTGGIAHDFNNMLGVIMGYAELSFNKIKDKDVTLEKYLSQILTASDHAKDLISSMMLFSRNDSDELQTLNISSLVKEDLKMLRSIIPTSIEIKTQIDPALPAVSIEQVKLQQLIMNLCVNARDAMNNKGILTLSLQLIKNTNSSCHVCYEKIRGDWVELAISDTGEGMSAEVQQRLFEPFFTTKPKGKGTGMGMAVVHGIVRSLNGHILIDSEVGKGTTIRILFQPQSKTSQIENKPIDINVDIKGNNQRILVVDDEEALSNMLANLLELNNYQCRNFTSSKHALAAFLESPTSFDLILSDQTMPDMSGLEMVKKMRTKKHELPVIIVTGYSDTLDAFVAKRENIVLLDKPIPHTTLLRSIKDVLQENNLDLNITFEK